MSAAERLRQACRSLAYFITAIMVSLSTITIYHQPNLRALEGGWDDPLKPLPFISAGFKSNNCGIPGYGDYVPGRYHLGTDIAGSAGDPVFAVADGIVLDVQFDWPGAAVYVKHTAADGTQFMMVYGHMAGAIPIGTIVTKGQNIGQVLNQGVNSHLHIGVRTILQPAPSNNGAAACSNWPETNGYVDALAFLRNHPLAPPTPPPPPQTPPTPTPPPPSTPPPAPQPSTPPAPKDTITQRIQCHTAINRPNESVTVQLGVTPKCGTYSL